MQAFRTGALALGALGLAACGPSFKPADAPSDPCPEITAEEFEAAVADGATKANAKISAGGMVSMTTGPGVVHCASYNSSLKPCRRPNDLVIRYELADGSTVHVRVPANSEYRFRIHGQPTTCEILRP